MGNHLMRSSNSVKNHQFSPHLDSHELDVARLQARVMNSPGVEVRAVSLDSLRGIIESLLEMNQEVVKVILECKKDIWRNQELFRLVEDYLESSLKTLDFCASLGRCLKQMRDQQLLILMALHHEGRALEELNQCCKGAGDPFTDDFFNVLQSVYRHQLLMLEKLQCKKNKLDKKLRSIHVWRKVSCIIFAATFASVLICSVVAAAVAAPPVAAALVAATSIPLGSMGKWIDLAMKKCEKIIKGQKELISSMSMGTYIAIKDLDNIRVLIERLEAEIEDLKKTAELGTKEETAVETAMDEKVDVLMKNVEELGAEADQCSRDTRRARTVILQRIINAPHS